MTERPALQRRILNFVALATVLAITGMHASAQDVTVRGSGTCQGYLDAKRNSVQEAVTDLTWFMGYMSGLAVARRVDILGKGDSADSMLNWVDAYCQLHPAKYLSDAGDLYYRFRVERIKASYAK